MAMKQTQTKMFDFSDAGLDFCAGSKSLFPDRFKKMLSTGYNTQTVASVTVAGNQVTLTYGVSHGYAADRVLKIDSGVLAGINGGEFWIDSVTSNTVTLTIDDAPVAIAGAFTTKIASLGWELVFEQPYIHVYKFKHIDDTDMYIRLCFQNNAAYRNRVAPCVGRTFDQETGFITDSNSFAETKSILTPNSISWEFQLWNEATYNTANYATGFNEFGAMKVVGSIYHLVQMGAVTSSNGGIFINAILPVHSISSVIDYPLVLCFEYGSPSSSGQGSQGSYGRMLLGKYFCTPYEQRSRTSKELYGDTSSAPAAPSSYLPSEIEDFNTTTAHPIHLYLSNSGQVAGVVAGGLYKTMYGTSGYPSLTFKTQPHQTMDIDLNSKCLVSILGDNNLQYAQWYTAPIEAIK
ncbi:hypothetical protein EXE25_17700 [Acinetobacter bouvetii]|uniref:Uncharacterized protein n=1 Tax=Acinetobacter bouvetii TaxID=202951 RepID=A0A4V2DNS1_9GAMM|nr:hypothetical protein [Acinetobacter bouvetii]RZG64073.1 hypothetical protein EXE25_17700 [Acinetobacter bouvetii]